MQRPVGVTILAILALIGGIFGIFGAILLMGFGGLAAVGGAIAGSGGVAAGGGTAFFIGVLLGLHAILSIAFAIGAFQLKPWAWILGIIAQGLSILTHLANFANDKHHAGDIFGILIAGVILYYLFTPPVRAAFGK